MREKVGIVVQARMGSRRLPGKVLFPIEGKRLLHRLCDRVALSRRADVLLVATSDQLADQAIEDACRLWKAPVFRGPEQDLTTRLLGAARAYNLTALVRVTGDNPLTDPEGIDDLISAFWDHKPDLVHNSHRNGYPYGTGAELIRVSVVEICDKELTTLYERENVMSFVRQHADRFRCLKLNAPAYLLRPQYFLTVDYPEDVLLLSQIYTHFNERDDVKLKEIIEFLDSEPALARLNAHLHQGFSE